MDILSVLVRRDGLSPQEANELLSELKNRVLDGEDPEEILSEELGLEPDYVFDLISF
jgi:hypothetical protein